MSRDARILMKQKGALKNTSFSSNIIQGTEKM